MQSPRLAMAVLALFLGGSDLAAGPERSLRPIERPAEPATLDPPQVFQAALRTVRPQMRPAIVQTAPTNVAAHGGFQDWITGFRGRALRAGISEATLQRAFRGVKYDPAVVRRDRNQNEFTKTIWDYLGTAVSEARIRNGRAALQKHRRKLETIEARYGVDSQVIVAIWGLESAYGGFRGSDSVIQSLATLAYDGRRAEFFEGQLMAALQILQSGDVQAEKMTGSWAGAMGHTQFMPTSYLDHAVDFTGDGKRDIWSDDPSDALASAAAYLKHFGWIKGQPWGVEVTLPAGFDYTLANRKILKRPSEWARLGVLDTTGRAVPNHGPASVLLPAGSKGAAFMIFQNFEVIERYNTADAYVIGIGHLGDRILGGAAIQGDWPRGDRALTYDERQELQRRLTRAGFDTKGIDGRIGPLTIDAVRNYQLSQGLVPDGYPSLRLLQRLR